MIVNVPKGGRTIRAKIKVPILTRTKENTPIGVERIIGVDTESLTVNGELKTVLIPYSSTFGDVCQSKPIDPDIDPIQLICDFTIEKFGKYFENIKEYRLISRADKGMRETLLPVLWVFYNLEYDLQRLFQSDSAFFRFLRQGRSDLFIMTGKYKIQIVNCNPSGSAPSFQFIIIDTELQKAARVYGMDMWGYWKTGLDNTAKKLGVGEKLNDEISKEWFQIPLEEWTPTMWDAFVRYGGKDANLTRGIYIATAKLLGSFSEAVFNRVGLLPPSAPAAAARLAFSFASEEEWKRPAKIYEQLALDAYHGGYVAMLRRGYVEGITVSDLHSAYPSAMMLLPDPCRMECAMLPPSIWTSIPNGVKKHNCMGFVRASFTIKEDVLFPSISMNNKKHTLHQTGHYEKFAISLNELSALFDLGQIARADIHEGFMIIGSSSTSFLRKFVEYFYEIKEGAEKDDPVYLVAKLLMNSLYGKLIEVHEPNLPAVQHNPDLYEWIVFDPKPNKETKKQFQKASQIYVTDGMEGLYNFSRMNKMAYIQYSGNDHITLDEMKNKVRVKDILVDQQSYTGAYFLPIHASLITAMTRAKLVIMLNCFDAIGGDTDSMVNYMKPKTPEWIAAEEKANQYSLNAGCGSVKDDAGLLGYGVEMVGGKGYVAGIKQYTLQAEGYKPKLAHHAITDPPDSNWEIEDGKNEGEKRSKARKTFCRDAVKLLATGNLVTYTTRSKPRRLRESLLRGDGKYGIFLTRERTVTPKEDERLQRLKVDELGTIHFRWKSLTELLEEDQDEN